MPAAQLISSMFTEYHRLLLLHSHQHWRRLLDLHNLTDDQLGELLNSFNYPLSPGASIYVISDGVLITKTVTNAGHLVCRIWRSQCTDTDTATVTVIPDPDFWVYLPTILKVPTP